MKWDLFVMLVDKFDLMLAFMQEEEYTEEEVFVVIRSWLEVELTCGFGLLYRDEKFDAFNVLYDFLKQRYREYINLNVVCDELKKYQEVVILDNGDKTPS